MKDKRSRPYEPDQSLLLPPNLNDWLPEGHPASFVRDVVAGLDLSAIYDAYAPGSKGGRPPCDPRMMTGIVLYAYCAGAPSSRKIERATYESIPFRALAANQHPDHDTICEFRKRHLDALSGLFVQVLDICRKAGLVKLGHVSLDARWSGPSAVRTCRGTKVRANASKHKANVATAKQKHGRPPSPPRGRNCPGRQRLGGVVDVCRRRRTESPRADRIRAGNPLAPALDFPWGE